MQVGKDSVLCKLEIGLQNDEFPFQIFGNTIHLHVIEDEYAAGVSNLQMYDSVR